ncbi:restriction endonuclease subunit S [Priestia megaterium]|uniref:restriction endonuclease subunit S n=1 Tax=Priestia megaterium TaxID=1404 RepID=UPI0035CAEC47
MITKSLIDRGWYQVTFSDIAKSLKRGPFGGNLKKAYFVPKGYKVYEQQHAINKDYSLGKYFINEEKYQELKNFEVGPGDYIVSCSGTIGRLYRLSEKAPYGVINQALLKITLEDRLIEHSYFSYLFQSEYFQRNILSDARGTGMKNLSGMKEIKVVPVLVPPLPEQRKISKMLDELFSKLDNAIANLQRAKGKLEVYRQAVLEKAFEGELTKEWREKHKDISSNFSFVSLKQIADVATGATPKKANSSYWNEGEFPWVTSGALNNTFVNKASDFITEKALKETNCKIFPKGTLLIAMYGEGKTRGKCSELAIDAATNQAIAAILIKSDSQESKKYLKWFFIKNYNDIRMLSSGGVQPNLNLTKIKETKIPFPAIQEQHQIVQEIETRLSVCDNILANIDEGLEKAEALRQSILKKAFEGRLLSEIELEACRREQDWVSAEELLEKIKASEE